MHALDLHYSFIMISTFTPGPVVNMHMQILNKLYHYDSLKLYKLFL